MNKSGDLSNDSNSKNNSFIYWVPAIIESPFFIEGETETPVLYNFSVKSNDIDLEKEKILNKNDLRNHKISLIYISWKTSCLVTTTNFIGLRFCVKKNCRKEWTIQLVATFN